MEETLSRRVNFKVEKTKSLLPSLFLEECSRKYVEVAY